MIYSYAYRRVNTKDVFCSRLHYGMTRCLYSNCALGDLFLQSLRWMTAEGYWNGPLTELFHELREEYDGKLFLECHCGDLSMRR